MHPHGKVCLRVKRAIIGRSSLSLLFVLALTSFLTICWYLAHSGQAKEFHDQVSSHSHSTLSHEQQILDTDNSQIKRETQHRYRNDGLLEVNFNGSHPILELIEKGQRDWKDKLIRSSKTLEEAVSEYKRRYRRPPPLNFDKWFVFVLLLCSTQFLFCVYMVH